ncbi:stalk domain-containing protein [Desulforudis sp. 1088]|uniref:stalk domain-containing protein n=1 Tax=unclassified Candidatus Desulforudis TaxID=2635950 RepID=UPI003CE49A81
MRLRLISAVVGAALFVGGAAFGSASGFYNGFPTLKVLVDGKEVSSDVPAIVMDGRALVPLRVVAENLDADVVYNPESKTVTVTRKIEKQPDTSSSYRYGDEVSIGDLRVIFHGLSYANTVGTFVSEDNEKIAILDMSVYAERVPSGAAFPKAVDVISKWVFSNGKEKTSTFIGSTGSPWIRKGEWVRIQALTTLDSQLTVTALEITDLKEQPTRQIIQLPTR